MKVRLGYLCSSESRGGLEMNHVRNAHWMLKRGHDVLIFGIEGSPIHEYAKAFEVPFQSIPKHRRYYDYFKAVKLKRLLQSNQISHLLFRSNNDMSIVSTVKFLSGKQLFTAYFSEMQLGVAKKGLIHSLRYRYIDAWSSPLNWLSDQVTTMTKFKNQNVVIPSGIDLDAFTPTISQADARARFNLPSSKLIFGIIGRFDPKKGQLMVLEALNKRSKDQIHLVIVGEPTKHEHSDYSGKMSAFINDHQLHDQVTILPFQEDIVAVFTALDWMIMATDSETFGMVNIESLACSTPVLGSNSGGTPEIVKIDQGGVLFEANNPTDLATKIEEITQGLHTKEPSSLRKLAEHYSHHSVCKKVEDLLGINS